MTHQIMTFWFKRRTKLIHHYSLVGYILSPNPQIIYNAREKMLHSQIYSDAIKRLIGKLLVPENSISTEHKEFLADMTTKFFDEHQKFVNQTGILNSDTIWYAAVKSDFVVRCHWHYTWMLSRTKVLGKLACLVLFKILGIGMAECNWKQVKKIKYGDHANLGNDVTAKITNVYGQYQQVKSRNTDDQRSSVGRLWTEKDLHYMKMDVFCADIADSLDKDARIQNMKTFCNWNKDWQQPSKGVGPRGDAVLEERLQKVFWGIKLLYTKISCSGYTVLSSIRKRERMDVTLLLSMSIMSEYFLLVHFDAFYYWSCFH